MNSDSSPLVRASAQPTQALQRHPRNVLYESGHPPDAQATVCITLYNYEARIVEALDSVFGQTLEPLALIVIDDCSSDGGAQRVERWMQRHQERFSALKLLGHERNQGLASARNGAVDAAESECVMILDADNLLYPRCVERLCSSLLPSGCGFAYSLIEQFDDRVGLMGYSSFSPELLAKNNYIDAMALIRKSTWKQVGGYSKMGVGGWEDYDFWCKCIEADIDGLFVPEVLARYRVHSESMLRVETDRERNAKRVRVEMQERHPWLELVP